MPPRRPFRFGVQITRARTSAEWRDQAQRAEALGYDIFLMADHFGQQFAIGPALAVVAEVTKTIRIGALVHQNDLRHPAMMAMEAATLDVLSDGRYELGIGAGGSFPAEYDWTGIPFDAPGARVNHLAETIPLIRHIWSSTPFSHTGESFAFADYTGHPKPVQQPHPPILIAAGGKRMLTLAANEANIIGLLPGIMPGGGFSEDIDLNAFARKVETIRDFAGPRFDDIELNILIQMFVVTNDRDKEIVRLKAKHEITNDAWFDSPMVFVGTIEEIVARMLAVRNRLGVSYFVVFEPVMETFAPVVTALAGR